MIRYISSTINYLGGKVHKLFNSHPESVCMSYLQHMSFALKLSLINAYSSIASLIHALFPFLFITTVSDMNKHVDKLLYESGCRN